MLFLLVHQTLQHIKEETINDVRLLKPQEIRIRPIFMSTLTSIFGMVPLVVFPGAGSELYRGLGSVVIGGLCLISNFDISYCSSNAKNIYKRKNKTCFKVKVAHA